MERNFISDHVKESIIITPNDGAHYFFGYYDMRATQGKRHLAHRVQFMDRLPEAEDVAQIGYLEDGKFTAVAETTAWNFQQGAMLQYHPFLQDVIYYNVFKDGKECTVTHNYATGEKKYTDRATACISPDGNWGLAVNFARIFAFRPGYGYAASIDPNADVAAPEDDGIFLTDMHTGKSRLLVNYHAIAKVCDYGPGVKLLVNHITFNPTSSRYVALVRDFPVPPQNGWTTVLLAGDLQGNIWKLPSDTYASHYVWQDEKHLIIHSSAENAEKKSLYRINTDDGTFVELDMPYFHQRKFGDIHCNISPDGKYVIGDGYPWDGYRVVVGYNLETGAYRELFRSRTVAPPLIDIRCDLHALFAFDGKYISYDTTENNCRQIALVPTNALLDF